MSEVKKRALPSWMINGEGKMARLKFLACVMKNNAVHVVGYRMSGGIIMKCPSFRPANLRYNNIQSCVTNYIA